MVRTIHSGLRPSQPTDQSQAARTVLIEQWWVVTKTSRKKTEFLDKSSETIDIFLNRSEALVVSHIFEIVVEIYYSTLCQGDYRLIPYFLIDY